MPDSVSPKDPPLEDELLLPSDSPLADDILEGVGPIAVFLYGADTKETRSKVYYDRESNRKPIGKAGGFLYASKAMLRKDHLVKASDVKPIKDDPATETRAERLRRLRIEGVIK